MHKKIKLALVIVVSVTVIGTGIWFGIQKFNRTKVEVYRVEELKQMIWGESSSLEGIITSDVSQKVQLSENQIVQEVFVQEGQEVKEGTPLLSYDMTLVHINLETEKLNNQQLQIKKKGLEDTLAKIKKKKVTNTALNTEYQLTFLSHSDNSEWAEEPSNQPENPEQSGNLGEVENSGVELSLKGTVLRDVKRELNWDIFFNLAHNKNKVKKINQKIQRPRKIRINQRSQRHRKIQRIQINRKPQRNLTLQNHRKQKQKFTKNSMVILR